VTKFVIEDGLGLVEFRVLTNGALESKIGRGNWGFHSPKDCGMTGGEVETVRLALEHIAPLFANRRPLPSVEEPETVAKEVTAV
jgi:hypothetical protein